MDRIDAEELAARMGVQSADRATHRFYAREKADGSWSVVKVRVPTGLHGAALKITAEHLPPRPFADDRRSGHEVRIPGLPGGLG